MTKIDIYSGFLGAGKTTLIKKMIKEAYHGQKIVLIENEFGEIGIDGGFLQEAGIQITEMNSGCICCSLVGDFGRALKKVIADYAPDRILIEPSGVGKLSDVIGAVRKVTSDDVQLGNFVTVADATKCKMYMKNFGEFYNNQIETANTIILSRTDGMAEEKLDQCVAMIREHNKDAVIVTTPWPELTGEQLMEAMEQRSTIAVELAKLEEEAHHHHHDHDDDDDECDDPDCSCHHHHHDDDDDEDEHEHHHHHHDDDDEDEHEHGHGHDHGHEDEHEHHDGHGHSHSHEGAPLLSIIRSAISHTVQVSVFIFLVTLILVAVLETFGESAIEQFLRGNETLAVLGSALVGLIPNCSASVVITQLYLEGALQLAPMLAGTLISAGVGYLVLFRTNRSARENVLFLIMMYVIGAGWGLILSAVGL